MSNTLTMVQTATPTDNYGSTTLHMLTLIGTEKELREEIVATEATIKRLCQQCGNQPVLYRAAGEFITQMEKTLKRIELTITESQTLDVSVTEYSELQLQLSATRDTIIAYLRYYKPLYESRTLQRRPTPPAKTHGMVFVVGVFAILVIVTLLVMLAIKV